MRTSEVESELPGEEQDTTADPYYSRQIIASLVGVELLYHANHLLP